jgi:hypothetical protein
MTPLLVVGSAAVLISNAKQSIPLSSRSSITASTTLIGMATCLVVTPGYNKFMLSLIENNIAGWYKKTALKGELKGIAKEKTLFLVHPHGVLSVGWSVNMLWNPEFLSYASKDESKKETCIQFLIDENLRYKNPLMKIFADLSGRLEGASKGSIIRLMKGGGNIALIPGGFEDATIMRNGINQTVINNRKGEKPNPLPLTLPSTQQLTLPSLTRYARSLQE